MVNSCYGAERQAQGAGKQLAGSWHECGHDGPAKSSQRTKRIVHGRCLVAAMDHAVSALLVPSSPVVVPVRVLDELREGRGIAVLKQITGLLPAEDVVGRVAPRRALVVHLAHEEVDRKSTRLNSSHQIISYAV